jgi:hypothetical protein
MVKNNRELGPRFVWLLEGKWPFALQMWREGFDTYDIAQELNCSEASIYNLLVSGYLRKFDAAV